jgi:hypothetical protein
MNVRKLIISAVAVAGLAFSMGCNDRDNAARENRKLAQKQVETRQDIADIHQDAEKQKADVDAKAEEKIADKRGDLAEQRQDAVDANRKAFDDDRAIGGAGTAGNVNPNITTGTVQGSLTSTFGKKLELVDASSGLKEKLKTDDTTQVTFNGRPVKLDDFKEGTQVRASYVLDKDHDKVARTVEILRPIQK